MAFPSSVARPRFWRVPRHELIAACVVLGFVNGITETVRNEIQAQGWTSALFQTFGLSVIIWIALYVGLDFILHGRKDLATPLDLLITAIATLGFLAPSSKISWLVLSGFAGLEYLRSPPGSSQRNGALVIAAMTVPLFWSKIVFSIFSGPILQADAIMVAWLVGLPHVGNVIRLPDGEGDLWIAAGCSSLANVSLAVLWWTVLYRLSAASGTLRPIVTCALACVSVVAINVVRISLMAAQPRHYDLLHGPIGATVTSWLTTVAIVAICATGLKIDVLKRH